MIHRQILCIGIESVRFYQTWENKKKNLEHFFKVTRTKIFEKCVKCFKCNLLVDPTCETILRTIYNYAIWNKIYELQDQKKNKLTLDAFEDKNKYLNNIDCESWL